MGDYVPSAVAPAAAPQEQAQGRQEPPREIFIRITDDDINGGRRTIGTSPQQSRSPTPPRSGVGSLRRATSVHGIFPRIRPAEMESTRSSGTDDDGGDPYTFKEYREFAISLDKTFWDKDSTKSTAIDIIAVYLKGQKILYIEAKTYCERQLTKLMLPAIFLAAACTVLSPALQDFSFGPVLISSLTALNSFILSIISFLKLDAKAEAHKTASYQFDKLQTMCEFHSGQVLFFDDNSSKAVINDIEKKVAEIKDNNQFIIPESVRHRFPLIYSTNVFAEVKKVENKENVVRQKLFDVYKQIQTIEEAAEQEATQLAALKVKKEGLLAEYFALRSWYTSMDDTFREEVYKQISASRRCCSRLTLLQ